MVFGFSPERRSASLRKLLSPSPEPARGDIPTVPTQQEGPYGMPFDITNMVNSGYYRELAEYEFLTRVCRKVRITVKNIGEAPTANVRIEIVIPKGVGIVPKLALPHKPQRTQSVLARMPYAPSMLRRDPGEVAIDENANRFRIEIDCKDLQPGRRVWSDTFYLGSGKTAEYPITGEVFADNLPTPQQFTLTVAAEVKHTSLTVDDLRKIGD
jgi:hypothetical protein